MEIILNTSDDYIKYVNKNWAYSKSCPNDQSTIPSNSLSWNLNFKAFRTNDASSSSSACLQIPVGYLNLGDKIEIECEVKNVSGTKCKVAVDSFPDTTYTSGYTNLFILNSTLSDGQFEHIKLSAINTTEGYCVVDIGVFTGDTGDFYVRNVKIKSKTLSSNANIQPNVDRRLYDFGNFELDPKYSIDTCTLTTEADGKTITLTHDKPFTGSLYGVAYGQIGGKDMTNYLVGIKCFTETNTSLRFRFFNTSTGVVYTIAELKADTNFWFHITQYGYN